MGGEREGRGRGGWGVRYFTLPVHMAEVTQNPRAVGGGFLLGFVGPHHWTFSIIFRNSGGGAERAVNPSICPPLVGLRMEIIQ